MTPKPNFQELFDVMAAASVGDAKARVRIGSEPDLNDPATKIALALNILLQDLGHENAELQRHVKALQNAEGQLRQAQKMEAVGLLAGGVAHDFNNALSVILSYCELGLLEVGPNNRLASHLGQIGKAAQRAVGLTRQLLAFCRQQVLDPKIVNLNDTVESISKMLQRILGEKIKLQTRQTPKLGMVLIDPAQMENILLNLAINARDAMPNGGILSLATANVNLDADAAGGQVPGSQVMLCVKDTGSGMDMATQDHAFEPFFTTKDAGKGTGLGLTSVLGAVTQNGGSIRLSSELGHGTTFRLFFPRLTRQEELGPESPASFHGIILVVNEEEEIRSLAAKKLGIAGYTVLEAEGADQALAHFELHRDQIQLLLTDVNLPELGGLQLAERLCETSPFLKVIFMSNQGKNALPSRWNSIPYSTFLKKPFNSMDLMDKVNEMLAL
jgi:two-component system cell cycle sensor histidine kinase/response regulator CckA